MAALAAALPLIVFAATMVVMVGRQQQRSTEELLRQATAAAVRTVDERISITRSALEMFASSRALEMGDRASLADWVRRGLAPRPDWTAMELRDRDGATHIVGREEETGSESLAAQLSAEQVHAVFRYGEPRVSGIIADPARLREPVVAISVPVFGQEGISSVLTAYVRAWSFNRLLRDQGLAPGWLIAVLDDEQTYLARTLSDDPLDPLIGTTAQPSVVEGLHRGSEFFFATAISGKRIYTAAAGSALTGWTIILGAPAAPLDAAARQTTFAVAGGGITALALALMLGWILARSYAKREAAERRVLALEAASAAEQRSSAILESTTDGVFELDQNWRITFVNSRARQLITDGRDLTGQDLWSAFPGSVGSIFWDRYHHAMETGEAVEFEAFYQPFDRWYAARAFPSPKGLAVYFQDITERRRAERALEEAVRQATEILESIGDAFYAIDRDWRFSYVNRRALELFGKVGEDLTGRFFFDIFPMVKGSVIHATYREVMADQRSRDFEAFSPILKRWTSFSVYPHASGGLSVYFRDISAQKTAEAALKASEARYRTLVEALPQMVWTCSSDGACDFLSRQWVAYTGMPEAAQLGSGWAEAIHPDDRDNHEAAWRRAVQAGTTFDTDARIRGADGSYRWFKHRAVPLPDQEGGVDRWFGTSTDITDLVEARDTMQAAKEEAERAMLSKAKFLASASHDLRQPLQSLFLFSGALHGHVQGERGRTVLQHLERGLDALKGLLDSLLDVSRLDAGVVKPTIEDLPVSLLLDHIAAGYAPVASGKGLDWRMTSCPFHVRSDRILLGRMIRNLVENAIRYTEHGSIEVGCEAVGDRLRIHVTDTGIGIAPDELPRVFEEFHQVGNQERDRSQGLGLGLAIVQRISQLLDHPVSARSELGKGTTFTIDVPLGETRALVDRGQAAPAPADSGDERFAVVVDDDAIVLLGLQAILKEWGYEVLIAGSEEQAIEKLRTANRTPDIVIADYRLRDGKVGTKAILEIRKLFRTHIPGIIVTGETGPECQRDAALHGIGLMHKPVTPRQLSSALERQLKATA